MIPLSRPFIGPQEQVYVSQALSDRQLSSGPRVEKFEQLFARYTGWRYGIATTSGTTALHLALTAAGTNVGDEVIVPDLTYVSTAMAVRYCRATPVPVDVGEDGCINTLAASRFASKQPHVIMPVHLYGRRAVVANPGDAIVIEDSAESLGLEGNWKQGRAACYSFYGNKVLTMGEGGMVVTDDEEFAENCRHFRRMATVPGPGYLHDDIGYNYRMTELQGAIGLAQLERLDVALERRRRVCVRYGEELGAGWPAHAAPWLFTLKVPEDVDRDGVIESMKLKGVETRPVFAPLHRLTAPLFARKFSDEDFPNACDWADRGISLPTFPELSNADQSHVILSYQEALRENPRTVVE